MSPGNVRTDIPGQIGISYPPSLSRSDTHNTHTSIRAMSEGTGITSATGNTTSEDERAAGEALLQMMGQIRQEEISTGKIPTEVPMRSFQEELNKDKEGYGDDSWLQEIPREMQLKQKKAIDDDNDNDESSDDLKEDAGELGSYHHCRLIWSLPECRFRYMHAIPHAGWLCRHVESLICENLGRGGNRDQ